MPSLGTLHKRAPIRTTIGNDLQGGQARRKRKKAAGRLDEHDVQPDASKASLYLYAARAVAMQMGWPAGLHFMGTPSLLHTGRRSNLVAPAARLIVPSNHAARHRGRESTGYLEGDDEGALTSGTRNPWRVLCGINSVREKLLHSRQSARRNQGPISSGMDLVDFNCLDVM
ncbi:hypothetical protein TgHK011_001915 [Trichoderma gracile]|nr:hypothetical protein TgHK011_001915 [Trichoderma gracile]